MDYIGSVRDIHMKAIHNNLHKTFTHNFYKITFIKIVNKYCTESKAVEKILH